jgi:transcriptional regulator
MLDDLVAHFDPTGWRLEASEEYVQSALDVIAGFEIPIERLKGKWKLSQNRSPTEQQRVATWLEQGDEASRAVAALMRSRLAP